MKVQLTLFAVSYLLLETFAAGSGFVSKGVPNEIAAVPAAAAEDQVLTTCSGNDSFSLEDFYDQTYDGCYSAITVGDATWFSLDGEVEDGLFFFPDATMTSGLIWSFGTATVTVDNAISIITIDDESVCYDKYWGDVSTTHPAEVTLWTCTSSTSAISDTDGFTYGCRCSSVGRADNSAPSSLSVGRLTTGGTACLALLGANLL